MARKKSTEEAVVEAQEMQQTEEAAQTLENTEKEAAVEAPVTELPEQVKKLLGTYPNYAALYIDSKGGIYTEDTQHNLVGDAILYRNPYYKS